MKRIMVASRLTNYVSGYRIAILLVALVAGIAGTFGIAGDTLENGLRSARDTIRNQPASGDIVIVEIDAQSLAAIESWPWPRSNHGQLVDRLNEAGVETIAFDIDFSSHSERTEDRAFADALQRSDALVLLPAFRQFAGAGDTRFVDSEPIDILRENAFLASVNIHAGNDGSVRRALLGVETNGLPRPSLAAMLSGTQGAADADFPIDYAIDPATIPRISYVDIISGDSDPAALRGKSVIVGATAIEMGDRYVVPRHGVIPGVVIQALAAESLASGSVPQESGPLLALQIAALGIILLILPGALWWRIAGAGATIAIILVFPLATEQWLNTSHQIVPGLIVMLAGGLTGLAALVMRKYRRTQLLDRDTGLPNRAALLAAAKRRKNVIIVAAQIEGYAEIAALLGADELRAYFVEIARRLGVASGGAPIHRSDDALLAWRMDGLSNDEIGDHVDVVAALFRSPIVFGSHRIDTSLCFGVAEGAGEDGRALSAGAALAAERAAAAGHRWERHVEGDEGDSKWQLSLLGELDDAMNSGALWVAFQPKFRIADRAIVSAEALVRWNHPERGPIPPESFVPFIERRGRIADLTLFVAVRSLTALLRWQSAGLDCHVAVNVSANLLDNSEFLARLAEIIGNSGVDPSKLMIEITESAALENPDKAIAGMEKLRHIGVELAIDDYGTGQSTLSYLKRLPVQELKIDKSFVQSIEHSQSDHILVRSTIELAHDLGLSVVAEGIETEHCLEILRELGCDTGQGYLVGKPMTVGEFERAATAKPGRDRQLAA